MRWPVHAQRGLVLLPVTLVLAIVGTLAYAMTRDGAMNVSAVDAQYETDRARYLAEAGVNLLKWRNEQAGCGNKLGFTAPMTALDGGTITASGITYKKPGLVMTVVATTAGGAVNTVVFADKQPLQLHNVAKKVEVTVSAQGSSDTFIRNNPASILGNNGVSYLETTEGNAHGLIKFGAGAVPPDVMVVEATLRLYLASVQSTQPGSLGIHRLLRDWTLGMGWSAGWTNAGGDFAPQPSATMANVLATGWYTARIDPLVQTWIDRPPTYFGLLMKPTGLVTARFSSFEAGANQPQLFLRYYPLCG